MIKEQYDKAGKFLQECKWYVVFSLGLFALFYIIGLTFPIFFVQEILNLMNDLLAGLEGLSGIEIFGFIFFNNLRASFLALIFGIGFGIFPVMTGLMNGYLLGFVTHYAILQGGIGVVWRILPHGIFELPAIILSIGIGVKVGKDVVRGFMDYYEHSSKKKLIISIPIICFMLGMISLFIPLTPMVYVSYSFFIIIMLYMVGFSIKAFISNKQARQDVKDGLRFFLLVILPLLLVAAIIESLLIYFLG
ncbi:MAG: stage II sporulation protein M [Candidatus Nanoarchaeia archaeon]